MHPLVRRLADDAHEADAQQALEAFGGDVLGTLYDHLIDEALPLAARRRLPPVFAAHLSRFGLVLLVRSLRRVPVPVRHAAVRALSKIHEADDFSFDPAPVDTAIDRDLRHYAALGQILRLCRLGKTGALPLPPARVQSFREEALERVFRLLGLRYDQRDIYDAYLGITSADPSLRDPPCGTVPSSSSTTSSTTPRGASCCRSSTIRRGSRRSPSARRTSTSTCGAPARRYLEGVDDPRLDALLAEDGSVPQEGDGERTVPVGASPKADE